MYCWHTGIKKVEQIMQEEVIFRKQVAQSHATFSLSGSSTQSVNSPNNGHFGTRSTVRYSGGV